LPDSIGKLKNLKWLNVSNNDITELPWGIGDLESLEELTIDFCPIEYLPESIKKLKSHLKRINSSATKISKEHRDTLRAWLPDTEVW
jgi:Leucine-rich repeat (LRR) protein